MSDKFTGDAARIADADLDDDNTPLSNWNDPSGKVPKSRMESDDLENTVKREKLSEEQAFLINNGNIKGPVLLNVDVEPPVELPVPAVLVKKKTTTKAASKKK